MSDRHDQVRRKYTLSRSNLRRSLGKPAQKQGFRRERPGTERACGPCDNVQAPRAPAHIHRAFRRPRRVSIMIFRASGKGTAGREQPAGIVVLDRLPEPAAPQLRAFVWCRCHPANPVMPTEQAAVAPFPVLMVGLGRNGEDGHPSDNGHS